MRNASYGLILRLPIIHYSQIEQIMAIFECLVSEMTECLTSWRRHGRYHSTLRVK